MAAEAGQVAEERARAVEAGRDGRAGRRVARAEGGRRAGNAEGLPVAGLVLPGKAAAARDLPAERLHGAGRARVLPPAHAERADRTRRALLDGHAVEAVNAGRARGVVRAAKGAAVAHLGCVCVWVRCVLGVLNVLQGFFF